MFRTLTILALLAGCESGVPPQSAPAGPSVEQRPNILLIMADDAGLECFGCTGAESYSTPNIDRLAAEGLLFTNAFAQPLCTPSRVKLLTGQSNLRNYLHFSVLKPGERTFAHMAQEAGYTTGIAGKWQLFGAQHHGRWAGQGQRPADAGFDRWCLWQVETLGERYWGPTLEVDGELTEFPAEDYGPDQCVDWLLEFMTAPREGPFLAYFPTCLPHSPFRRTPSSPAGDTTRRQNFVSMVEHLDLAVGRLHSGLEAAGLADNTWIVFTSDNGTDDTLVSSFGGETFRGGKAHSTDAGTRVPLIVWGSGLDSPNRTCADLVDLSDVYPTLRSWCGSSETSPLDGLSFAPQVAGLAGAPREVLTMYSNPRPPGNERNPRVKFARDLRFKLYDDGRLFDLDADPAEEQAIGQSEQAQIRSKLEAALASMPAEPGFLGQDNQSPQAVYKTIAGDEAADESSSPARR